jgi:hypothetical protein
MPAGDDPDLDAIFADVPANSEQFEAAAPDATTDAAAPVTTDEVTAETPAAPGSARPERPRGPKLPWWDVYTSMLAVTLLAIILGCVFLAMEWSQYNFQTTPSAIPTSAGGVDGG